MKNTLPTAVPKPRPKPTPERRFSSIKRPAYKDAILAAQRLRSTTPPKRFNPEKRAKREKRNQEYYKSAEWRAKRQAVFARDRFQCVEVVPQIVNGGGFYPDVGVLRRCDNRGEVVNGKQTSRGLQADEESYGHRGISGSIDRIKTRCKDCHRRKTVQLRANHSQGFQGGHQRVMAGKS